MQYTGKGREKILIVAEAPGETEDRKGTQLIGKSGQLLRKHLRKYKIDLDRDCWKTNALICYPDESPVNDSRVLQCRPNLLKTIRELNPRTIILLGGVAVKSLIGKLWREDVGAIGRWVGWRIPCQQLNMWRCPTWHPSYLLRQNDPVLDLHFGRHLGKAIELNRKGKRPWREFPFYRNCIRIAVNESRTVEWLHYFKGEKCIAFDYETTALKPDAKWTDIVSCSVCNGSESFSFPWQGEAIKVMSELLRSPIPKIAHNAKFEDRWTRAKLGHGVRNWKWDTMQAAHVLDNRQGTKGLTFQAFVQLGQKPYDNHIGPYLRSKSPKEPNRIREAPLRELLLYGGLDSLLTYKLAQRQMKQMGVG